VLNQRLVLAVISDHELSYCPEEKVVPGCSVQSYNYWLFDSLLKEHNLCAPRV
jgi:hypothetical protein